MTLVNIQIVLQRNICFHKDFLSFPQSISIYFLFVFPTCFTTKLFKFFLCILFVKPSLSFVKRSFSFVFKIFNSFSNKTQQQNSCYCGFWLHHHLRALNTNISFLLFVSFFYIIFDGLTK